MIRWMAIRQRRRRSRARTCEALERLDRLLRAKLSVGDALSGAAVMHGRCRTLLAATHTRIRRGERLSTALQRAGAVLSPAETAVLRAGEQGGDLAAAVHLLHRHLQRQSDSRRAIRQAAAYPLILLLLAVLVLAFSAVAVLPAFAQLYHQQDARLPGLARALLASSRWSGEHALAIGLAWLALTAAASLSRVADRRGPGLFDRAALALPVVGSALRDRERIRFYGLVACLLRAGSDLGLALSVAAPAVSNRHLREHYRCLERLVRNGRRPSVAIARAGLDADGQDRGLLEVAEAGGDYAGSFEQLAALAEHRRAERLTLALRAAEPAAVAVVAIAVGVSAIAIYQPILGSSALLSTGLP